MSVSAQGVAPERLSPLGLAALDYAERGLCVFPLKPGRKGPTRSVKTGEYLQGEAPRDVYLAGGWQDVATSDQDKVREWWLKWPTANIGLNCMASGLVALDADTYKADCGWDTFARGVEVPATWTQQSARGGLHYIFADEPDVKYESPCKKLDVKHDGYILLEPSIFEGKLYECLTNDPPAPAPDWIPRKHRAVELTGVGEGAPPDIEPVAVERRTNDLTALLQNLPDDLRTRIEHGESGDRSVDFQAAVNGLVNRHVAFTDALALFEANPNGPAEKYIGGNRLEKELQRSWDKALKTRKGTEARASVIAPGAPVDVRLLTWQQYREEAGATREYIVEGYIRGGTLMSVNARPGVGKTALLIDICRALSAGEPWNGADVKQCACVYIAAEDPDDVAARLEAVGDDRTRLLVSDDAFLLTKPERAAATVRKAIEIARQEHPELPVFIVVDTLRAALGGKSVLEDQNTAPGLNALRAVAEQEHAVIAIANHTNRSDPTETKGETLESVVALEFILAVKGNHTELQVGKNRSGRGRQPIGVLQLDSVDVQGVSAAVVTGVEPYDASPAGDSRKRGRPSGAAKAFVDAIKVVLDTDGKWRTPEADPDSLPNLMASADIVEAVFNRDYTVAGGDPEKRADAVRKALTRGARACQDKDYAKSETTNDGTWWWLTEDDFSHMRVGGS